MHKYTINPVDLKFPLKIHIIIIGHKIILKIFPLFLCCSRVFKIIYWSPDIHIHPPTHQIVHKATHVPLYRMTTDNVNKIIQMTVTSNRYLSNIRIYRSRIRGFRLWSVIAKKCFIYSSNHITYIYRYMTACAFTPIARPHGTLGEYRIPTRKNKWTINNFYTAGP